MTTMSFLAFVSVRRIPAGDEPRQSRTRGIERLDKLLLLLAVCNMQRLLGFFSANRSQRQQLLHFSHTHTRTAHTHTHTQCVCLAVTLPVRPRSLWLNPLPNFVHLFDNVWHCVKPSLLGMCVCLCVPHACGMRQPACT